ncbi:MAG TPA: type II toxin-antitoxin system RelE/ParE family toxin [Pirellulaceae bacterium]|nr:type II toxin-antitoxin system RelE/ParE family toxin [Pirellulaceae bacterium]
MKYTVCWTPLAENDLADIWLKSFDRAAVTDAANRIDRILEQGPLAAGAVRDDGNRHLIVPPLVVTFDVSPDDRMVTVNRVRFDPSVN